MLGSTLGDLLKAGQLDLLKQASSDGKSAAKKLGADTSKNKPKEPQTLATIKSTVADDYKIFHSYVRTIVQKSELYDTMFDYGDEESFATVSELYDNAACKDIIDYFACCFFDGEYDYLDSIVTDCERGNDTIPDQSAVVLGHKLPITYREEYDLLSLLYTTAISLDARFDEEPNEETVIVYNRTVPTTQNVQSSQSQSEPSHTKQENTKALRKAQDVVNVSKKGGQVQHVKVVKQPVASNRQPENKKSVAAKQKQFVAAEWQQFITDHSPLKPKEGSLADVLGKQSIGDTSSNGASKPKENKIDKHQKKTQQVLEQFTKKFDLLGVTDVVVELYKQKRFPAILSLFRNDFWKHYSVQYSLDQSAYKALWNDAHNYIFEFIMGKKRYVSNSVVSFRKRSFSSHIANSGVWGRIAAYGGTNGRIISINSGHGRR